MRMFKKVWSDFDQKRTGYLQRADLVPFFSVGHLDRDSSPLSDVSYSPGSQRLSGVFDVKIYPSPLRVKALRLACFWNADNQLKKGRAVDGLDLEALDRLLNTVDRAEVAQRKKQFNRLYQEALLSEEPGKGVSFTNMLLILAQYKLVDPQKALK